MKAPQDLCMVKCQDAQMKHKLLQISEFDLNDVMQSTSASDQATRSSWLARQSNAEGLSSTYHDPLQLVALHVGGGVVLLQLPSSVLAPTSTLSLLHLNPSQPRIVHCIRVNVACVSCQVACLVTIRQPAADV